MSLSPIVLIDQPEDGYCESVGWVEATLSEEEARDFLSEWCVDEDGNDGFVPTGPAKRVKLSPQPGVIPEEERWYEDEDGQEFWEIVVA